MTTTSLTRWIVGCMTGTSLDGIDAALVKIQGRGLAIRAEFIALHSAALPAALKSELAFLASGSAAEPVRFLRAARELGQVHVTAVEALLKHGCVTRAMGADAKEKIDAIVAHGQTIWHVPQEKLSWQLFDPWPLSQAFQRPICYDLRQADLIASGQGAPITPMSDWVMYRSEKHKRLIVNLGGICNVTVLPANGRLEDVRGMDLGPCNLLIDGIVKLLRPDLPFDINGQLAAQGQADPKFRDLVHRTSPFFSRPVPRTTGREDFHADWLNMIANESLKRMTPQDLIASAVDCVAKEIALFASSAGSSDSRTHAHGSSENSSVQVILAGGGAKNPVLVKQIRTHTQGLNCGSGCCPMFSQVMPDGSARPDDLVTCSTDSCPSAGSVLLSDDLGIPIEAREAMGFAVLGALSADGLPITLPAVTGARQPGVAGAWVGTRR